MKQYLVVAEFEDVVTGNRLVPATGDEAPTLFTPHDETQAERLVGAGCLRAYEAKPKAAAAPEVKPKTARASSSAGKP